MSGYADDRAAVQELISRYALECDRQNFTAVGECFTVDGRAEYSGVELPPGRENIVAHLQPLARLAASQHHVGTVSVTVTGDTARASSYTVAHLVREVEGGHEVLHRGLSYDDELVRTGEGWRFAQRRHRVLWSTSSPTTWPVPRLTPR